VTDRALQMRRAEQRKGAQAAPVKSADEAPDELAA
jgi:hypothetical protein